MSKSSIQVIFFDAAGTLFKVKGSVGEIYLGYAKKYGILPSAELTARVNHAFEESFAQAPPPIFAVEEPEKLKQCERLWWFDIVHGAFYRIRMFEGFDDYFDEVYEAFGTADHWEVYPEVPDVLRELKVQGYELGVISNFDTRFFKIFRELNLDQYFDSITISSLAGSAKPSPKIFKYALDQHALDPDEAIYIGDSIKEDMEGARQAKILGILVDREKGDDDGKNNVIKHLNQVPEILEKIKSRNRF